MKNTIRVVLLAVGLAGAPAWVGAQTQELRYDHRVAGDRALTLQLGVDSPHGLQNFAGVWKPGTLADWGGTMGINLDFYLDDRWRLGGSLKGMTVGGRNDDSLFLVPITFRGSYEIKVYPLSFIVGGGIGFCFTNYGTETGFHPVIAPEFGAYYNLNSSWSLGLALDEWAIIEPIFPGSQIPTSDGRVAYFGNLTFSAIYHF